MKLYATTTSERATKSQGGNDFIHIDIRKENREIIAECHIETFENGTATMNWTNHISKENRITTLELKGKSQKGERIGEPRKNYHCKTCKEFDEWNNCVICGRHL